MSDLINSRERDFSIYDQMTDDQLCQILRSDAKQEGCEDTDMELILHVMEVLAKRREDRNEQKDPVKAFESFKQNYAADEEPVLELVRADTNRRKKDARRWKPGLVAAAAALAIVICGTATAGALGIDVVKIVGKWTQDTFYFAPAASEEDTKPYAQLQDLLEGYNITDVPLPSWLPEGYEVFDARVNENPTDMTFISSHKCEDKMMTLVIDESNQDSTSGCLQGGGLIELYERAGTQYYIFANNEDLNAAWISGDYECYIAGPVTLKEMKKIIDSIGKG